MNRKGNARDLIFMSVMLLVVGICCFIGVFVFNKMSEEMRESPAINSTAVVVESLEATEGHSKLIDYFGMATFIGFGLAIIITGWFIGGNPIFMILYFLVNVIGIVACMVFSNVWETVTQASVFDLLGGVTTISMIPITNHIITYLPIYMSVVTFLSMVAMFGKPYFMGGGGEYA